MIFQLKEYKLKDNTICQLKNAEPSDALDMIKHMKNSYSESHFLARYPDEIFVTEEEER